MGGLILKINATYNKQYSQKIAFKQTNSIEHLSGIDVLKKYEAMKDKKDSETRILNNKLNDILYNAIFLMEQKGLYKEAKILYEAFVNDTNMYDNPVLNNVIGKINKKTGDLEESRLNFNVACCNLGSAPDSAKIDIMKNYYESNIILGNKELPNEAFVDFSFPYTNEIYLYLSSILDDENNDKKQESNNIKAAYRICKSLKYVDDDVILKKAFVLSDEGDYENSNGIILKNLDRLKEEGKVYTKEFVDYMLLLGVNVFETSDEKSLSASTNIFKNVSEISEIVGLEKSKEIADYSIAKNLFIEKSDNFCEFAKELLNNVKDREYQTNLNEMLGDFMVGKNNTESSVYYETAISFLENDDINKGRLFELYKKLKKVKPKDSQKIDEKIKNLNVENLYDTKHLNDLFVSLYSKANYEKLEDISNRIIEKTDDKTNKTIAQMFLNLAKIQRGNDMTQCLKQVDIALKDLEECLKKTKSKQIAQVVSFVYKSKASILFSSMRYKEAAAEMNKSLQYMDEDNNAKDTIKRNKIIATLYNYKAKDYTKAESQAINYLELLLDKKFESTKPLYITLDVDEILKKSNDTEKKKIASAYETLGLINLKNYNFKDSQDYFMAAVNIRERMKDKDLELANSYAALARLAIFNSTLFKTKKPNSSKDLHQKCLDILKTKYPTKDITAEEEAFHKKYYGKSLSSAGKYIKNQFTRPDKDLIDKFKCYFKDKELSICE